MLGTMKANSDALADIVGRLWRSRRIAEDHRALCALGGRFAGTPSEAAAREFLAGRLREATGAAVRREVLAYTGWSRGPARLTLLGHPDQALKANALVRSRATPPGGLEAEVIDLGRGTPEEFAGHAESIRGRIVLVRHEFMITPGHIHRRRKYEWAKQHGAVGFLVGCHIPGHLLVTGSSGLHAPEDIPAAGITYEAAALLAATPGARVRLEVACATAPTETCNLIAEIPGQTDEWVVLSAHIDGHDLAESAIDNGSGLSCVLTIAEALADRVPHLRRGLRVALYTIEEWGVQGSRLHVERLSESERRAIALNVNLDSVAGSSRLVGLTSGFPELDDFVRGINADTGLAVGTYRPFMSNSDHGSFVRHGIPGLRLAAGFGEPLSNLRYILTPADTIDKVDPIELKGAAATAAAWVLAACASDGPIARHRTPEVVARIVA
jgi:hypothetical protein